MCAEVATYRVQLHARFTLDDAAAVLDYLAQLGISHLYSSPILQAGKESTHGYDVLDHSRVNSELGGGAAFDRLTKALAAQGLGLMLDIVPNHMAIGQGNGGGGRMSWKMGRPIHRIGTSNIFGIKPWWAPGPSNQTAR